MAYTLSNPGVRLLPGEETRIQQLAICKNSDSKFNEDRRSVYWTDGPLVIHNGRLSDRQKNLALPKLPHQKYKGDRPSPIWNVSRDAMRYRLTKRTDALSCHKLPHIGWQQDKPVQTVIKMSAMSTAPSKRVIQLSQPKEPDCRYVNPSISLENLGALGTICMGKDNEDENVPTFVERLANPKATPKGYKSDRPVKWAINRATLGAEASDRVDTLSKIRRVGKRSTRWYNFNEVNEVEDPYAVSNSAKKATASARVSELATPIARKMRQKK